MKNIKTDTPVSYPPLGVGGSSIKLNHGSLILPSSWDDIPEQHRPAVFRNLHMLFAGICTPFQFQLQVLMTLTGYRPELKRGFIFCVKRLFYITFYRIFKGKRRLVEMLELEKVVDENIQFNLIQLAERIKFAFTMDGNKIIPNYDFAHNPFPRFYNAPSFDRDVTVETSITARQFSDCIDLLTAYHANEATDIQEYCLYKIMSVLYDVPMRIVKKLPVEIPFGVMFWFQGIVKFFQYHPIYSILFNRSGKDQDQDPDKINLGMSEVILFLEKEGYQGMEYRNIIDFFNAQIKALKDSISGALGSGMKPEDLAEQTEMSITNINRLSND